MGALPAFAVLVSLAAISNTWRINKRLNSMAEKNDDMERRLRAVVLAHVNRRRHADLIGHEPPADLTQTEDRDAV